ncbi:ADP-ribosyltransferase [Streptoverticillium reticulum]|uniref:ADP-ribosyltransferase n=1 Tax=Streptoverticillium reticulum TaxID=1433415 RepID=UPI0039BF5093
MLDPSQIWLFTGDFDALERDATGLKKDAGSIRGTGGDIHSQFQGLSAYYHAPEADELFKTTLPVRDKSKDFAGDLEKVSSALTEFASEGRPLAAKLKSLKQEAEQFVASVKDDKDWEYDEKKTDHHNRIRDDIDAAVAAFQEAERRCANKITGLYKGGTHWTTDDGSHGKGMYGFKAEDLKHAKLPWGDPVDQKHHWYEVGHWIKSFVWDGIVVDGIWGTVKGLGTLVGFDGWDKAGQAWTGLAKLATGLAISSLPGVGPAFWAMPADKMPSWLRDSRTAVKETGKALVAWDEWSKNPARAAGGVTFNVLTTVFTGGSGGAAKAGAIAKTVSVLGKAGEVIDPMTYVAKGLGKGMSALNISVPRVGDLMAGLRDGLGGPRISPAGISLPHDMNLHMPEAPAAVPAAFHDAPVKLPDGTLLHGDGTMATPAGVPHQDPIPVEANAADRAVHQQLSAPEGVPGHAAPAAAHADQPTFAHAGGADNAAPAGGHGGYDPHPGGDHGTPPHSGGDHGAPHDHQPSGHGHDAPHHGDEPGSHGDQPGSHGDHGTPADHEHGAPADHGGTDSAPGPHGAGGAGGVHPAGSHTPHVSHAEWEKLDAAGRHQAALQEVASGTRHFPDDRAAVKYGGDHWNDYAENLPPEQAKAIHEYTCEPTPGMATYVEMNGYLRGKAHLGTPHVLHNIEETDKVLAGRPLPEDVMVVRGTGLSHIDVDSPLEMVGDTFPDNGYMSTSLGNHPVPSFGGKEAILRLRVPKGTPALWVERISEFGVSERELLLGRGVEYRVTRVFRDNGQWQIYGEVLPVKK